MTPHRVARSAALAAVSAAALTFSLTSANADTDASATLALHWNATYLNGYQSDVAPTGDSIGDSTVDLFKLTTPAGKAAGLVSSQCTLVRAGAHSVAQCSGVITTPTGTIALAGSTTGTPRTTYAVTGGTGTYRTATGTAVFTPSAHGVTLIIAGTGRN